MTFEWDIDYYFMWSQTGHLVPGVRFHASQKEDAEPKNLAKNSIVLSKPNGGYKFIPPVQSAPAGSLMISTDNTVPNDEASVAVGMSGQPAFAKNAKTNMNFTFSPHPEYWIVFGDYQQGQVMDFNLSSSTFKVTFPNNIYSKILTFNEDNTFSETSLMEFNEAIRQSREIQS